MKITDSMIDNIATVVYKCVLACVFVIVTAGFFGDPIDLIILGICIAYAIEIIVMLVELWRSKK